MSRYRASGGVYELLVTTTKRMEDINTEIEVIKLKRALFSDERRNYRYLFELNKELQERCDEIISISEGKKGLV